MLNNTFQFNPVPSTYSWEGLVHDSTLVEDPGIAAQSLAASYQTFEWRVKYLSKLAWQIRRIEAKRFNTPLMRVSWRRCLTLASVIDDRRRGIRSWFTAGLVNDGLRLGTMLWS